MSELIANIKYDRYVLLARMRTGSNLFENLLKQIKDVRALGELFNPSFVGASSKKPRYGITPSERDEDPIGFLNYIDRTQAGKFYGFRLFDGHDHRVLHHVIKDTRCAKIILRRKPIEAFISLKIAFSTNQWLLSDAMNRRMDKIEFDQSEYQHYLEKNNAYYNDLKYKIRQSGQNYFEISYEELLDQNIFNGLLSFCLLYTSDAADD